MFSRVAEKRQNKKIIPIPTNSIDSEPPVKKSKISPNTFLGRPLNKYDIDEITPQKATTQGALGKLTALSLAIPTSQKSLQLQDQTVRDSEGRRRFHGAFTGGFSAGYYNTVGTAEGWTPASFQSSRANRENEKKVQRVEDFMDDEDIENMASTGRAIELVSESSNNFKHPHNSMNSYVGDNTYENDDVLSILCKDTSGSINYQCSGFRILRSMGWREGNPGVMASTLLRPPREIRTLNRQVSDNSTTFPTEVVDNNSNQLHPKETVKHIDIKKRILGPERPTNLNVTSDKVIPPTTNLKVTKTHILKNDDFDDWWLSRRRAIFDALLLETKKTFICLKSNRLGLGSSVSKLSLSSQKKKKKKNIHGGFGIGILEEEEDDVDDVYDIEGTTGLSHHLIIPDDESTLCTVADLQQDKQLIFTKGILIQNILESETKTHEDAVQLHTFLKQHDITIRCIPAWFTGHYSPSHDEIKSEHQLRTGGGGGQLTKLVNYLKLHDSWFHSLQERMPDPNIILSSSTFIQQRAEILTEHLPHKTHRNKGISQADNKKEVTLQSHNPINKKPLWSRVTDDTKKALIASLISGSKFVKASDSVLATETSSNGTPQNERNIRYPNDTTKQYRYELFCLALEEKVAASKVLEAQKNISPDIALSERKEFGDFYRAFRAEYPYATLQSPLSDNHQLEDTVLQPKYSRISCNWRPDPVICKRLGIPNPWEKRTYIDDRPTSELFKHSPDSLILTNKEFVSQTIRRSESRSGAFVEGLVKLLGPEETNQVETPTPIPSESISSLKDEEEITERPPLSIFKSVFGDDEDDDN